MVRQVLGLRRLLWMLRARRTRMGSILRLDAPMVLVEVPFTFASFQTEVKSRMLGARLKTRRKQRRLVICVGAER